MSFSTQRESDRLEKAAATEPGAAESSLRKFSLGIEELDMFEVIAGTLPGGVGSTRCYIATGYLCRGPGLYVVKRCFQMSASLVQQTLPGASHGWCMVPSRHSFTEGSAGSQGSSRIMSRNGWISVMMVKVLMGYTDYTGSSSTRLVLLAPHFFDVDFSIGLIQRSKLIRKDLEKTLSSPSRGE
ncbi:hypothetical protein B0H17DRAFT_1144880 [Mycena rosella]|uniref:Uncharacterized protein n=1 Tax=Mycena rosella TaxID=1033263 RepID=A0AAD7CT43_MYCRO|nr:hypothetical protein B0H17DRAFT_1144880 [Mycena rosella]